LEHYKQAAYKVEFWDKPDAVLRAVYSGEPESIFVSNSFRKNKSVPFSKKSKNHLKIPCSRIPLLRTLKY
jgi:hypothetical protein